MRDRLHHAAGHGAAATYIPTAASTSNVCVTYCSFCSFYRTPGSLRYVQTYEQIGALEELRAGRAAGPDAGRHHPEP